MGQRTVLPNELDDIAHALVSGRRSCAALIKSPDRQFSAKLHPHDGVSEPLETFRARFENFASHFWWDEEEMLFNLRNCLEKVDGNVLLDNNSPSSSLKLIALLYSHYGN